MTNEEIKIGYRIKSFLLPAGTQMQYIITLTDEAVKKAEIFFPQIEQDLAAAGAVNIKFLPTIGVVNANFENAPNLAGIRGVLDCEESKECFAQ